MPSSVDSSELNSIESDTAIAPQPRQRWLYMLFFLSGIPALIYQIVWQRALFSIYGVNIEAVTVVVTAFMLGLGLGSIAGGQLSRTRLPLVPLFAGIELCTSIYGVFSLQLFHIAAQVTAGASTLRTGICAFILVAIPTVLMGATLPILLTYLIRVVPNIGRATGMLYFVNTLGAATACFVAGQFTMRLLGMSGSVRLAAAINALIGFAALTAWLAARKRMHVFEVHAKKSEELTSISKSLPLFVGIILAAVSGFIALGYEIVWYRVFSWASGTNPKTFAFMLGAYLAGLSFGSLHLERRCRSNRTGIDHLSFLGRMLVIGNILAISVPPIFANLATRLPWDYAQPAAMVILACAAAVLGTTFPMVCHLTVRPDHSAGEGLSFLYVANIIGSALGSFVVGYILFDMLTLPSVCGLLAAIGIVLGSILMLRDRERRHHAIIAILSGACVLALVAPLYRSVYERLLFKTDSRSELRFVHLVENRHGVIAVSNRTVFGGGVYDGQFNVDPVHDINMIRRCYALAGFLSRPPKHVLMIGLSSGSWAQVLVNNPDVESLTIVEINPGYLKLIPQYPEVASILLNPKIKIVIDDGRRWLLQNPDAKFDLVAMNTSFSWRASSTNLLSREALELVRQHLETGGVHFYNTTYSPAAQYTAASVFPYSMRIGNFVAVSDAPLHFQEERWKKVMEAYHIDGNSVIDLSRPADQHYIDSVVSETRILESLPTHRTLFFESEEGIRSRLNGYTLVTDDNMAVEWRGSSELALF